MGVSILNEKGLQTNSYSRGRFQNNTSTMRGKKRHHRKNKKISKSYRRKIDQEMDQDTSIDNLNLDSVQKLNELGY